MGKTLGQKIKDERKKNKLTQRELAGDFITRNMLSQIENNQARPSITTMAYLAKKLNRSIDYFMNEQTKSEQLEKLSKELMTEYEDNQSSQVLERLYDLKEQSPALFESEFIKDLFVNCHMKRGSKLMDSGDYEDALAHYEALLEFETEFLVNNELTAYELYTKLVDAYTLCQRNDEALVYNMKAKELIRKLMATKEVQNIYLLVTEEKYKEAIKSRESIEYELLDAYNKARLDMVTGHAYFQLKMYRTAVEYLEKGKHYFETMTYNSLTIMIYEELGKCYSNLEEHDQAVLNFRLAKESMERGL